MIEDGLLRRGAPRNDGVALVIGGLRLALRAALFRPTPSKEDLEQKFFAEHASRWPSGARAESGRARRLKKATACLLFSL
jgi:hypothetical protein